MDQTTQRTLIYGATAIVVGYAAYQIYMSMSATTPASSNTTTSSQSYSGPSSTKATPTPKKPEFTPKGDPMHWSEDDMKKFLSSRNLGVGLEHASKHELQAMVESKLHEPGNTSFDDPQEWSTEEMKDFLRAQGHQLRQSRTPKPVRMFLDAWINYFRLSNSSRITGLSIHDPFAIAGIIMLLFLIPTALVLLTVTARRSAESIWDGLRTDARYRELQRSARRSRRDADIVNESAARNSHRSNRATRGTLRVSFMLPGIAETPGMPQTPATLRLPETPRTPYNSCTPSEAAPFLSEVSDTPSPPVDRPSVSRLATPSSSDHRSPAEYDFTDVYERYHATQRPPQLNVTLEEAESRRRWTCEFQEELRVTAMDMV
ncbi:hypothetical protein LTR91_008256 [Friedmanniomyces endolithicus]|uniref:Uncharacterized protein n=1 Tax=Friedmanniomyces endolithicus TaxID=329885 RepID=A0AAN6QVI7_9PEZI|nr:hypothetical protein LTR94_014724 [Friedmanniomyces endolithicus]KAK0795397.1 hypothetical protein LTR59_007508 [Friedmanniomyces endolithicus]KAK0872945.1 hypothetical protein LTR87_012204 [Friedmanniomyces endolithicus]KAK0901457.1 hypothetical protein LTR02_008654 [Friedmanniomyces endolithicus]KAK0918469.1 hypothetical protein LTR57_011775 [Friedmanniomyces endolithicus]